MVIIYYNFIQLSISNIDNKNKIQLLWQKSAIYFLLNYLYYYFMSNFVAKQRNRNNDTYAYLYANVCEYSLLK